MKVIQKEKDEREEKEKEAKQKRRKHWEESKQKGSGGKGAAKKAVRLALDAKTLRCAFYFFSLNKAETRDRVTQHHAEFKQLASQTKVDVGLFGVTLHRTVVRTEEEEVDVGETAKDNDQISECPPCHKNYVKHTNATTI